MNRVRNLLAATIILIVLVGGTMAQHTLSTLPTQSIFQTSGFPGNCC